MRQTFALHSMKNSQKKSEIYNCFVSRSRISHKILIYSLVSNGIIISFSATFCDFILFIDRFDHKEKCNGYNKKRDYCLINEIDQSIFVTNIENFVHRLTSFFLTNYIPIGNDKNKLMYIYINWSLRDLRNSISWQLAISICRYTYF
jgi:hypothetical protein